ncbi:MAG: hypothetical protein ACLGHN_05510 [Bacteriovoracia bacterium]
MKIILFIPLLLSSAASEANLEHKPGHGVVVDEKRVTKARGCFAEAKLLGCSHPREGVDYFKTCLREKNDHLTSSCRILFRRLYGERE